MRKPRRTSFWLLMAMLLGAALAGRSVLISATPAWLALAVSVLGVLGCCLLKGLGRGQSAAAILWCLAIAVAVGLLVWWTGGRTMTSTWWTALAFACLAWAVCRALLCDSPALPPMPRRLALFGAGVIAYQICSDELYDFPILLMRGVAIGVLLLAFALWLVEDWGSTRTGANTELAKGVSPSGDTTSSASGSLLAPSLAVFGFVVAILGSLTLEPARSWASRLRLYFWEGAEVMQLEDFDGDGTVYAATAGPGGEGGRSLPRRADIRLGNSLRAVIRFADRGQFRKLVEAPIYVRTLTLSVIEGDGVLTPLRQGQWIYDAEDGASDGRVTPNRAAAWQEQNQAAGDGDVRHTIYINTAESSALPVLAGVKSIELNEVYEYADDWYQLALQEGQEMIAFRAVSDFTRVAGAEAVQKVPSDWRVDRSASDDYLQLPQGPLTLRLRQTANEVAASASAASLSAQLDAVRSYLDKRCRYSLEYDNPDDLPAVENFLFGERRGHCEMFAATTVMLLRGAGIPARVAYGFSGGTARAADRVIAFRDRDFHAWAEVLIEGQGWVVFDTTPIGDGARSSASPVSPGGREAADTAIPDLSGYQLLQGEAVEMVARRSWVPAWLRAILDFASLYLTEICLLSLAGFMSLWLVRVGRARRRRRRGGAGVVSDGGLEDATPGYLESFLRLWEDRGVVRRPGQTMLEFVARLKSDGLCRNEFDGLLRYAYGVRYAGADRDHALERRLRQHVSDFADSSGREAETGSAPDD